MDWREYEEQVLSELTRRYPNASIRRNVMVPGRHSGVVRQLDLLIEELVLDSPIRIVVDAKHRRDRIDVNDVEAFLSMMSDVDAHRGLLISSSGYTKAALGRAHSDPSHDLELDVLTLAELKAFQGPLAIPYSGAAGVLLPAPFGWVVDATKRKGLVACLYERGSDFEHACQANEWMYLNFWKKDADASTINDLLRVQQAVLGTAKIDLFEGPRRDDGRTTLIRKAEVPGYPTTEYTGFVEFASFILFVVMFSPSNTTKRNLRKLREVLRSVLPIQIGQNEKYKDRGTSE